MGIDGEESHKCFRNGDRVRGRGILPSVHPFSRTLKTRQTATEEIARNAKIAGNPKLKGKIREHHETRWLWDVGLDV